MPRDVERFWRTTQALRRFDYGPRPSSAVSLAYSGAMGGGVTTSDTPPAGSDGALWFDTVGCQLYTFYDDPSADPGQWVIANSGIPGPPPPSGGGIPEAPLDGSAYGRQSASWTHVLMATGDVVDGGNF